MNGKSDYINDLIKNRLSDEHGVKILYCYQENDHFVICLYGSETIKYYPDLEEFELQKEYKYQGSNEIRAEDIDKDLLNKLIAKVTFRHTAKPGLYDDLRLGVKRVTKKDEVVINKYREEMEKKKKDKENEIS